MSSFTHADSARNDHEKSSEHSGKDAQACGRQHLETGVLGQIAGQFPSDTFLWFTLGSIVLSASMKLSGRSKDANFVGEWAPTFLALGIFSKLKKIEKAIDRLG